MLRRKIEPFIINHLTSSSDKILLIEGARQIGKSFIIRKVGRELFPNFVEINFVRDAEGDRAFGQVRSIEDFYLLLSSYYGQRLGNWDDTLVFLDEIQQYPQYLTWLKFLREDRRYRFIASGSFLGIALRHTTSVPVGSVVRKSMYQLDFEEFMWANGVGDDVIDYLRRQWRSGESLSEALHERLMGLFRRYLLVGGFPDAVQSFLDTRNMVAIRAVQQSIREMYLADAAKYETDAKARLLVQRIYNMLPSQMENKHKRIVAKEIEGKAGARFASYTQEFEYLLCSGIALGVNAVTNPKFPLAESLVKNLIKMYLNDVGLLTMALYRTDAGAVLNSDTGVNLGAVYESVVAQELKAHGYDLFYYDNKKTGEVDFLIDDYTRSRALPIEVKSGKDYTHHSALNRLLSVKDYGISEAVVFSNTRSVERRDGVTYLPVYYVACYEADSSEQVMI